MEMRLAVDTRGACRPGNRPQWKRPPGQLRHTVPGSVKYRLNLSVDAVWDIAVDRCSWRELQPQLVQRD